MREIISTASGEGKSETWASSVPMIGGDKPSPRLVRKY